MSLPRIGIFAGSFDPVHNGHINTVQRVAPKYDHLFVAIAKNPAKTYLLPADTRVKLFRQAVADISNVEVVDIGDDFLVFEAKRLNAPYIIRGVRNSSDLEAEMLYFRFNRKHWPQCDTELVPTLPEFVSVSSSFVRGLIGPSGWHEIIQQYVPYPVYISIVQSRLLQFLTEIWQSACGQKPPQEVVDTFFNYGQTKLDYHIVVHPVKMIEERRRFGQLTQHPLKIDLAILGHDLVNIPGRSDNIHNSIQLMSRFMTEAGMPIELCSEVAGLMAATETHSPQTSDQAFLVDLDLSILGQPTEVYDDYSQKIRREYAQFPDEEFRIGRIQVLQSFLSRPTVYHTPEFQQLYEQPARDNIKREISHLTKS